MRGNLRHFWKGLDIKESVQGLLSRGNSYLHGFCDAGIRVLYEAHMV